LKKNYEFKIEPYLILINKTELNAEPMSKAPTNAPIHHVSSLLLFFEMVGPTVGREEGANEEAKDGEKEGEEPIEGLADGREDGLADGREDGLADGREDGLTDGRSDL
jgi:flagellar biosynthesis/type III secretory pathway protein FliH